MAEITNPQAVKFCNEQIRPAANAFARLYYDAKRIYQTWTSLSLGDVIVYDNADAVIDGSASDGRPVISGVDANNLMTRLGEIITDLEADSNAKLNTILKVAPNPGDASI